MTMQEIEEFNFSGTMGGLLNICGKCQTTKEATRLLDRYREYTEFADKNLGYIFGYLGEEERKRLYALFPRSHPVFGSGFGRGKK